MAHEKSETVQRKDGKWINRTTVKPIKQLGAKGGYATSKQAVLAAKKRSALYRGPARSKTNPTRATKKVKK